MVQDLLPRLSDIEGRRYESSHCTRSCAGDEAVHQGLSVVFPAARTAPSSYSFLASAHAELCTIAPSLCSATRVGDGVAAILVPPPVDGREWDVSPQREGKASPQAADSSVCHHLPQAVHGFTEVADGRRCVGCRLHSCPEHLNGADSDCGEDTSSRAGDQGDVCVGHDAFEWRGLRSAHPVVSGEVDDVGRNGHDQGRREASPKRGQPFVL